MEALSRRVKALGRPEVWISGRRVSRKAWGSRRAQELFFLLMNHSQGLSKDQIVESLFPHADGDEGDALFHSTLYRCRSALGREAVVWEDHAYRIKDLRLWKYDVADFEALAKEARQGEGKDTEAEELARTALHLYRGDYLEGWGEQWCEPVRERLRQLYVAVVLAVADSCADRGLLHEALDFYRLGVAKDYYCGAAHRGVMQCLLGLDDQLAAVHHYSEFVRRLQEDVPANGGSDIPWLAEDILGVSGRALLSISETGPGNGGAPPSRQATVEGIPEPPERFRQFTELSNSVIDYIMPGLSATAWKILTAMFREASRQQPDIGEPQGDGGSALSYATLKERIGVSSDGAIARALKELLECGYVVSVSATNGRRQHDTRSLLYELKPEFRVKATRC